MKERRKENLIEWLSSIATGLIIVIGMFIAWNPNYPHKYIGFGITCIGFLLAVFLGLGIIRFNIERSLNKK